MDQSKRLTITRRRLPHWQLAGSVYFITFRLRSGELSQDERAIVFDHIKKGRGRYYFLFSADVMPDHVHLLLKPNENVSLSRIMKGIKGVSARKLNLSRGSNGAIWQDESYDRMVRDEAEFLEKLEYISLNAVKAGLAPHAKEDRFWFVDKDACFA
jgi:REP element-mobilizing transposase RayT